MYLKHTQHDTAEGCEPTRRALALKRSNAKHHVQLKNLVSDIQGCTCSTCLSYLYAGFAHLPKYLTGFLPLRRLCARVNAARVAVHIRREPVTLHIFHPRERLSPPSHTAQTQGRTESRRHASQSSGCCLEFKGFLYCTATLPKAWDMRVVSAPY